MKTYLWIWIITFGMDGAAALEMLAVPLMAITLGASSGHLGIVGALRSLTYAAVCPLTGHLSDRIGYRRMMILSCGLTILCYGAIASVSTLSRLFLVTPAIGIGMAMFWPSFQAWFSKGQSCMGLLRLMGSFNIAWGGSSLIGSLAGGVLYAENVRLPFYVGIAVIVLVGIFLSTRPEAISDRAVPAVPHVEANPQTGEVYLFIAWIANFTAFFIVGVVRYIFPKMATDMGIDARLLGLLLSLVSLTQTAVFLITALTDRWQYRMAPLLTAQGFALLGMLLLGLGTSAIVFGIGLALIGVLCGIAFCSSFFYSLFNQPRGGVRAGWHEAILGSGFLFGPFVGGWVAEYIGIRAPYVLCAALLIVVTGIQGYLLHDSKYRSSGKCF